MPPPPAQIKERKMLFILSRLWNTVILGIVRIMYCLIWDYTGYNKDLIAEMKEASVYTINMLSWWRIE
jgi:hypothetical protein